MPIEQAEFGRTGHQSSRVIFGGAALGQVSQRVADETLDVLLAHGVNHLDVASEYGEAEVRIRPWLQREPDRFFLATKGDERTAAGARSWTTVLSPDRTVMYPAPTTTKAGTAHPRPGATP